MNKKTISWVLVLSLVSPTFQLGARLRSSSGSALVSTNSESSWDDAEQERRESRKLEREKERLNKKEDEINTREQRMQEKTNRKIKRSRNPQQRMTIQDLKDQEEETARQIKALLEETAQRRKDEIADRERALEQLQKSQDDLRTELQAMKESFNEESEQAPAAVAQQMPRSQVTTNWKVSQAAEFNRLATLLSQTISRGESDDEQAQDFKKLFAEQQSWFDVTLTNTRYIDDENYQAIERKNRQLALIVLLQQNAEDALDQLTDTKKMPRRDYDKLRTMMLYDLNALFTDPDQWNNQLPTHAQLVTAVENTLKDFNNPTSMPATASIRTIKKLQTDLQDAKDMLEEKIQKIFELQMAMASNTEIVEHIKKEIESVQGLNKELSIKLAQLTEQNAREIDALKKSKVELEVSQGKAETEAKEIKSKLDQLTAENSKATQEKQDLAAKLKDAEKKADDLADKKREIEKQQEEADHQRRILELQVEKQKFQDEQESAKRTALEKENAALADIKKDLATELEAKNKRAFELEIELEKLRRSQQENEEPQSFQAINQLKKEFETQINELKKFMTSDEKISKAMQHTEPVLPPPAPADFKPSHASSNMLPPPPPLSLEKNMPLPPAAPTPPGDVALMSATQPVPLPALEQRNKQAVLEVDNNVKAYLGRKKNA